MKLIKLAALGAAAYYFLDPNNGAARRENVKNKLNSLMGSNKGPSAGSDTTSGMGTAGTGMGSSGMGTTGTGMGADTSSGLGMGGTGLGGQDRSGI